MALSSLKCTEQGIHSSRQPQGAQLYPQMALLGLYFKASEPQLWTLPKTLAPLIWYQTQTEHSLAHPCLF